MSASEKSAAVIRLKLCLNCLHPGHRVSQCTAKGRCSKCKGRHHSSIHGIRVHSTSSNSIPQRSAPVSSQPPSRTHVHANIVTHDACNVASVTETNPSAESISQSVTTNCAPSLNTNTIDIQSIVPLPVDIKPSYDTFNISRSNIFVDSDIANSFSTERKTSLNASNHVILLKTAKATEVVNDKTVIANVFFDEGSQRSYIRAGFAKQLGLKPESYELLSVSSFGGHVTNQNYSVTTIGLDTPSGIELVKVLVSDEIVQPLNQSGCSRLKTDPRFHDFKFANDFNDDNFEVDILIGADAAYHFLGAIDTRINDMFIQSSKFGSIVSGPLPTAMSLPANHAKLEEVPSFHTSATQCNNDSDSHSPEPFPSSLSITNVVDNAELSVQFERILQSLSDNAQTFKRAKKDLQTLLTHFDSPTIQTAFTHKRIRFLFIPAHSPHWGGVYERMVGLMKSILKKVLGRSLVTLAELCTLIKEIQAVLNDRPHTVINPDVHELQPLTPNHLLFGFNITSLPHPSLDSEDYDPNFGDTNAISRAQHYRTTLYRHFLQHFHREYLQLLCETHAFRNQPRTSATSLIKDGDVVLVADTDTPRHRWSLGVVSQLLKGSDSLCRAAVVRTTHGHTTRSIIKLSPLELMVSKEERRDTVDETNTPSVATTHLTCKAARDARDTIRMQLIDQSQD